MRASARFMLWLARTLALLTLLVSGCSSWPRSAALPDVPLLPPSGLGQQWQLTQSVTLTPLTPDGSKTSHTLLAAWSVTSASVDLAGLTLSGQTLLTASYDGRDLVSKRSPLLPEAVAPRDILTQLQLAYWPLAEIQRALAGSPWHIRQQGEVRELWLSQRRVLSIHRAADTTLGQSEAGALESLTLTHHLMHYQLEIHTLTRDVINTDEPPVGRGP